MKELIRPHKLSAGDKAAAISLSWGGAGDFPHQYQQGKRQSQEAFGIELVETTHALKPSAWLTGGCLEVLEMLKGTDYWPAAKHWEGAILFWEASELMIHPKIFRWIIRNYVAQGIIANSNAIILGRPFDNRFQKEYNDVLLQIIRDELQMPDYPVIAGMDFGHTSPTFTIPIGRMAEIDCDQKTFSIIESAVSVLARKNQQS